MRRRFSLLMTSVMMSVMKENRARVIVTRHRFPLLLGEGQGEGSPFAQGVKRGCGAERSISKRGAVSTF